MKRRGPARVLVVDDQPRTAELMARLAPEAVLVESASGKAYARFWSEAEPLLHGTRPPDLVILDMRFEVPDEELLPDRRPLGEGADAKRERRQRRDRQGIYIFERLRRALPDVPVVVTTAHEEIPFEADALRLKADAFAYTVGEEEATGEGLLRMVRRVLSERDAPAVTGRFLWGRSAAMRELRRRVSALAPTTLPLLVTGPTGTGKNLLAREVIHPLSGRKGPFVGFDCATVPETLLPAALFGSVRGSFTGSVADRPGIFEAAGGGTLFLDEIENLSPDAQKALLTALNDGVVRRIGATAETPHSARVVAASNTLLTARVTDRSFRADLLMRLNPALALELPRLAERRDDLPELALLVAARLFADPVHRAAIVSRVRAAGAPEPDPEAAFSLALSEDEAAASDATALFVIPGKGWKAMLRHAWPGNLRQFDMVLTDLLSAALFGGIEPARDKKGRVLFSVDSRLLFALLADAQGEESAPRTDRLVLDRPRVTSVEEFRRQLEIAAFRHYFQATRGDFARMAEEMTGSRSEERAVRLRWGKLGLSVRDER